jgi:hypothetical protein
MFHFEYSKDGVGTSVYYANLLNGSLSHSEMPFQYRTDFNSDYRNNGLIENRPSIMTFHSISNKNLDDLRTLLSDGIVSPTMFIKRNRESLDALLSVKYYIDYRNDFGIEAAMNKSATTLLNKGKDFDRYSFKYYIPIGFSYDTYVTHEEFEKYLSTQPSDSIMPMLENIVIESKDAAILGKILKHGKINNKATLDSLVTERRKNVAESFIGDTRGFKMKTNFDKKRIVYVSVVADPGFTARIDGEQTPIYRVNLSLSAIVVPKGKHQIDFDYTTPGLHLGILLSLIALLLLIAIILYERRATN